MQNCIFVGIGGFIGSVCRYIIGLIPIGQENEFPIKTLLINILGAFIIGAITTIADKGKYLNPQLVLMIKVGICGGFTTFSTFAYETTDLLKNGNMIIALGYVCASVILSVLAVFVAQILFQ
jgi:CrcB protein